MSLKCVQRKSSLCAFGTKVLRARNLPTLNVQLFGGVLWCAVSPRSCLSVCATRRTLVITRNTKCHDALRSRASALSAVAVVRQAGAAPVLIRLASEILYI